MVHLGKERKKKKRKRMRGLTRSITEKEKGTQLAMTRTSKGRTETGKSKEEANRRSEGAV